MPKRTTDYRSALLDDLKDPREAAHYLNAALRDSEEALLVALRDVAEARQMAKVAETVGVSRESLYRMLSASGNPTYRNFFGILRALGVEFGSVRASPPSNRSKSRTG
jgi:probable addiction module antidote protein